MDTIVVFLIFFAALLFSVYHGLSLLYPLLLGLICFLLVSLRRGHSPAALSRMMTEGAKKSLIVIKINLLIGAITAAWRASGTVAYIVYNSLALINPDFFILSAFLLCCLVSFLLGTAFGTVGTVGVVLIILAKTGNVNLDMVAGAIIAGAYFGDRCSPMSSSANLVASLTQTNLYANVKNMLQTTVVPLVLAVVGYGVLSYLHPLTFHSGGISAEIAGTFVLSPVELLPALLIFALALLRMDVKVSIAVSILASVLIAVFVQHQTPLAVARYLLTGFTLEHQSFFATIIQGGGIYSMLGVCLIVIISSAYSGIFEGTGLLTELEAMLVKLSDKVGSYSTTMIIGVVAAAFSCNQTMAVILTHQFQQKLYERLGLPGARLALDLENTVIVLSALLPWNIAGAIPAATLSADAGYVFFAFYLLLVPLVNLLFPKRRLAE